MFSPTRARRLENQVIKPFVDLAVFDNVSSIRSSQGDVYFCDLSVQVIRGAVFEDMWNGDLPFRWQGKKSYPLLNTYGFDIDEQWQKVAIENWIQENWNE
jgi:alanine-alpha-ketoisovalerate/valine-pyruvate aminotransferase